MTHRTIWVLGAPDPEMAAIESLLLEQGQTVEYASAEGRRCHAGNAYSAAQCDAAEPLRAHGGSICLVECDLADARYGTHSPEYTDCAALVRRFDHHRPGDPGYGVPPAEFLRGSSLGQVLAVLGVRPSAEHLLVAAADHCLPAAYRGECPGIDPDALMRWRAESRAAFQLRPVSEVLEDIERAVRSLRTAPRLILLDESHDWCDHRICGAKRGGDCYDQEHYLPAVTVADMRGQHVPELPEAAARLGMAFVADGLPDPVSGRIKVILQSATAEHLAAWPAWAASQGITGLYGGDPARGFAGGYRGA